MKKIQGLMNTEKPVSGIERFSLRDQIGIKTE